MFVWKDRLRAAGIHLGLSLIVALSAGALVFGLWYPYPYREISGGRELFMLVITVDVILGPLITFAIFNRAKPWSELRRDLAIVGLIQLAGLGYGLWTVQLARPVHMVFEIDRFRVVHAVDIPADLVGKAPAGIDVTPWTGPTLLSLRPFRDPQEKLDATLAALQGVQLGARPDLWQTYAAGKPDVLQAARPARQLKARFAAQAGAIDATLAAAGRSADNTVYLPLVSRREAWTVFLDPATADVVTYMPLDSF